MLAQDIIIITLLLFVKVWVPSSFVVDQYSGEASAQYTQHATPHPFNLIITIIIVITIIIAITIIIVNERLNQHHLHPFSQCDRHLGHYGTAL